MGKYRNIKFCLRKKEKNKHTATKVAKTDQTSPSQAAKHHVPLLGLSGLSQALNRLHWPPWRRHLINAVRMFLCKCYWAGPKGEDFSLRTQQRC